MESRQHRTTEFAVKAQNTLPVPISCDGPAVRYGGYALTPVYHVTTLARIRHGLDSGRPANVDVMVTDRLCWFAYGPVNRDAKVPEDRRIASRPVLSITTPTHACDSQIQAQYTEGRCRDSFRPARSSSTPVRLSLRPKASQRPSPPPRQHYTDLGLTAVAIDSARREDSRDGGPAQACSTLYQSQMKAGSELSLTGCRYLTAISRIT